MKTNSRRNFIKNVSLVSANLYLLQNLPVVFPAQAGLQGHFRTALIFGSEKQFAEKADFLRSQGDGCELTAYSCGSRINFLESAHPGIQYYPTERALLQDCREPLSAVIIMGSFMRCCEVANLALAHKKHTLIYPDDKLNFDELNRLSLAAAAAGINFRWAGAIPAFNAEFASEHLERGRESVKTVYCFEAGDVLGENSFWGDCSMNLSEQLALVYAHLGPVNLESLECSIITTHGHRFNFFPNQKPAAYHLIFHFLNQHGETLAIHQMRGDMRPKEAVPVCDRFALDSGIVLKENGEALFISSSGDLICGLDAGDRIAHHRFAPESRISMLSEALISLRPEHLTQKTTWLQQEIIALSRIGDAAVRSYFLSYPGGNRAYQYPGSYIKLKWDDELQFGEDSDANQFLV